MVLEPKFVDYGSIHATADVPQIPNHSSHVLINNKSSNLSLQDSNETEAPKTSQKTDNMTPGDKYQRQPLLSQTNKAEKRNQNVMNASNYDTEDEIFQRTSENNGIIKINMPLQSREEPKYPQERWKTFWAFVLMFINFILTVTSLALVHERVPDREVYGPLSDEFLDYVPEYDWALSVSEYIIIICMNSCILALFFHKHRFIVFRRLFLILSVLYMYRAITMFVTVLPLSSKGQICSPKSNHITPLLIVKRVIYLMSGFGLAINGKHIYCGDFIYSGHTVILVISYLFISEYTPKKIYLIHWIYWILSIIGVLMLQLSHGHYTVDVIIAYYITTRVFWIYHTMANYAILKQSTPINHFCRAWWFFPFMYFEKNVNAPIPKQFDWPFPWPRRFQSKNRGS